MKVALTFADERTHFIDVGLDETVVDAALRSGVFLPVDCREGVCSTCRGSCVSGDYELRYVHEDALTQSEREAGAVLCCQMVPRSDCVVDFDFASPMAVSAGPGTVETTLLEMKAVSDSVSIVDVQLRPESSLDYLPGQYAHLRVPDTSAWRSYSFATANNGDGRLRFIVRMLAKGEMSDYLRDRASPGDSIVLEGPFGSFHLRNVTRPVLLIAGGTGISAILGMLDGLLAAGSPGQPLELLYGVTDARDVCELERLESCARAMDGFSFETIAMDAPSDWAGSRGQVTDLLCDRSLYGGDVDVYVCGPPPMVEATRAVFREKRLDNARIYTEKFSASRSQG